MIKIPEATNVIRSNAAEYGVPLSRAIGTGFHLNIARFLIIPYVILLGIITYLNNKNFQKYENTIKTLKKVSRVFLILIIINIVLFIIICIYKISNGDGDEIFAKENI